jgi:hypothetical protein
MIPRNFHDQKEQEEAMEGEEISEVQEDEETIGNPEYNPCDLLTPVRYPPEVLCLNPKP